MEAENGSPWGLGIARSMYTHWYSKYAIYKISGIGIERNWLGSPVGKAGDQADEPRIGTTGRR